MTKDEPAAKRWAMRVESFKKQQIVNGAEGNRLQQKIFDAVDDFYKFLDRHDLFRDEDKRRLLGIGITITCDTNGDMETTIHDRPVSVSFKPTFLESEL